MRAGIESEIMRNEDDSEFTVTTRVGDLEALRVVSAACES